VSDNYTKFWYQTPGQFWQGFTALVTSTEALQGKIIAPSSVVAVLVDDLGCRGIDLQLIDGPSTTHGYVMCQDIPAGGTIPLRAMLQSTGFDSVMNFTLPLTTGFSPTPIEVATAWSALIADTKTAVIEEYTDGTVVNEFEFGAGVALTYQTYHIGTKVVSSDRDVLPTADKIGIFLYPMIVGEEAEFGALPGAIEGHGGVSIQIDTSKIVDAINAVADMNYDISLNHGQSIFSVRGRTLVGS
jgi:hypothetical protein